ncbi:hypothetical protein J6590_080385 [Homalodisca vitripennis]|nr:hypothetical protein J6590_080385 [Homalodisca vitripennis]
MNTTALIITLDVICAAQVTGSADTRSVVQPLAQHKMLSTLGPRSEFTAATGLKLPVIGFGTALEQPPVVLYMPTVRSADKVLSGHMGGGGSKKDRVPQCPREKFRPEKYFRKFRVCRKGDGRERPFTDEA